MFKLIRYLRNYKKEAVFAPLFKLLEATFELLVPLVVAGIIDVGIASANKPYIISHGILLVLMGAVGLVSAVTAQYFSSKAAAGFGTELRDDLFHHCINMTRTTTERIGTSTLITRMTNDSNRIQNGVNMFFRLVLRSPFIVFGAMFMAYTIKSTEGLFFTGIIALLGFIVVFIMHSTVLRYRIVQKHLDGLLGKTAENLEGIRVIRAFRRENAEKNAYEQAAGRLAAEQIIVGRISALMNPLTYAVINLGLAAVLQTGAIHVNRGDLTQGQVVALINYISQILVELLKLANLIILLSKASASAKRINELFEITNTIPQGTLDASKAAPSVQFSAVTFAYPDAKEPALSDITFTASPGETVGIIGGTGSGKTTLANLITRFYDPSDGTITLGGNAISDYTVDSLRKTVGIVEQSARLFSGTIAENISWGNPAADDAALMNAAETAQAAEIITGKQGGLTAEVEQLGRNFSGGQKQRLSIARTLLAKPSVLILDDSASALDFATDAKLRKALKTACAGSTVFIISQRVTTIRHADHIIVLDNGRLIGDGTHESLLQTCPLYKEICLSQLSEQEVQ